MLEDEGVAGDVTLSEVSWDPAQTLFKTNQQFKLELIPVEDDLLSMEMDDVARDIYLVRCVFSSIPSKLTKERRRYASLLLFFSVDDTAKSVRAFPTDTRQRRCCKGQLSPFLA